MHGNDVVALVGAPVASGDDTYIAMLRSTRRLRCRVSEGRLGGGEQVRFAPGDGSAATEVDGWRVGLGIRTGTGTMAHLVGSTR